MKYYSTLAALLLFRLIAVGQTQESQTETPPTAVTNMTFDIYYIADDVMMGRFPGTEQADLVRGYIDGRMRQYGLRPMGEDGYFQEFPVPRFVEVGEETRLQLGKNKLQRHAQFYPVAYSSNGTAKGKSAYVGYGIVAPELNYDSYEGLDVDGKVAVLNVSAPDGVHPHSAYLAYHGLQDRIELAKERGAVAVVLINPEETASDTQERFKIIRESGLPVVFVRDSAVANELMEKKQRIELAVAQQETTVPGYNVIGFIDNGASKNVVIGAHYDHIGMGEENSLYKGPPAIHNGADDNGSGTVLLLELMRALAMEHQSPQYNYVIQFYSAEELGLIGSKYWTEHPTFPLEDIHFMINYDMVGKLRENRMQLSGTGTAKEWDAILDSTALNLDIKRDPNGIGPSDQTSFYLKDIPVLHFFTGTHPDYHKPTDDAEGIMIEGMVTQLDFTHRILAEASRYPELQFQKTKSEEQQSAPRFSVTLGVIPDYLFQGPGLRIDGATEGKPAALAGMKAGDIILELGAVKIEDIYAYMRALASFKKGDQATAKVKRGEEILEMSLQF